LQRLTMARKRRRAFAESGAEHACRNVDVIADGGYIATSAIIS
jgi:hypothetical protein